MTTALGLTSSVDLFGPFGAGSFTSNTPSLSSSVSFTSGIPSPSVSRKIVIGAGTFCLAPSFLVTSMIAVVLRTSSPSCQLVTLGVPVKFPFSTAKPVTPSSNFAPVVV